MPDISATKQKILTRLINEAVVDANGPEEELMGLAECISDNVTVPFEAKVVGESVKVVSFEEPNNGFSIKAVCQRGARKYKVDLTSIEWGTPLPKGFDWILAYLEWQRRF